MKVLETKIELETNKTIKLGVIIEARITVMTKDNVLVIPKQAVCSNNQGNWVTVIDNEGNEVVTKVEVGYYDDWHIEVINGLKEGDQVSFSPPAE